MANDTKKQELLVIAECFGNVMPFSDGTFDFPAIPKEWGPLVAEACRALAATTAGTHITVPFNPCLAKLRDGEPFFVLLGRDKQAPNAVMTWANDRQAAEGKSAWTEQARTVAHQMAEYSGISGRVADLCEDEGCPNRAAPHVCTSRVATAIEQFQARVVEMIGNGFRGFHFTAGPNWDGMTTEQRCAFILEMWSNDRRAVTLESVPCS